MLSDRGVSPYLYLAVYNLFFVVPLFVIVGLVGFGASKVERIEAWREKSRKAMRLVSGGLLVLLGLAFVLGKV